MQCLNLLNKDLNEQPADNKTSNLAPQDMKHILDEYVISQEDAKKKLSVAVYNHYKRIAYNKRLKNEIELEKSNILMIGPTGSGKTLLAKTLSKILDVPFALVDATTLTEAGYVGEDVENILVRLLQNAGGDVELAERGIIYIDEIDKVGRKSESASITRDVSGEGVQQALLKIIEGTIANLPPQGGRKHPHQEYTRINTTNILFILGGAFVGLDKIIKRRLGRKTVGFGTGVSHDNEHQDYNIIKQVSSEDLLNFGLIPELVGRLSVMAALEELDETGLMRVLTEPKNSLTKQYYALFEMEGVELRLKKSALKQIVKEALARKCGARGLRTITEDVLLETMYELPSLKNIAACEVDERSVRKDRKPKLIKGDLTASESKKNEANDDMEQTA